MRLEAKALQQRWVERTGYLVERDVMVGAFSIRKLVESNKVSHEVERMKWEVTRHLPRGPVPDVMNRWSFWESFDLRRGAATRLNTLDLCNAVVHSFVFGFSADEATRLWDGFYVTSDWKRRECLYFVPVTTIFDLFRAVGNDDIVRMTMKRNKDGEMRIHVRSNTHG
jgi:hypothetical protein